MKRYKEAFKRTAFLVKFKGAPFIETKLNEYFVDYNRTEFYSRNSGMKYIEIDCDIEDSLKRELMRDLHRRGIEVIITEF